MVRGFRVSGLGFEAWMIKDSVSTVCLVKFVFSRLHYRLLRMLPILWLHVLALAAGIQASGGRQGVRVAGVRVAEVQDLLNSRSRA